MRFATDFNDLAYAPTGEHFLAVTRRPDNTFAWTLVDGSDEPFPYVIHLEMLSPFEGDMVSTGFVPRKFKIDRVDFAISLFTFDGYEGQNIRQMLDRLDDLEDYGIETFVDDFKFSMPQITVESFEDYVSRLSDVAFDKMRYIPAGDIYVPDALEIYETILDGIVAWSIKIS